MFQSFTRIDDYDAVATIRVSWEVLEDYLSSCGLLIGWN